MTESLIKSRWSLYGTWGEQRLTLGEFAQQMQRYLTALQQIHPDFKKLFFIGDGANNCPQLDSDLENLNAWVLAHACHPSPSTRFPYSHLDAKGRPTDCTTGGMGFSVDLADSVYASSKGGLKIRVAAGRDGYPVNVTQLDYFHPTKHDMLDLDLQERLLQVLLDHWPLEEGALTSRELESKLQMPANDSTIQYIDVGWLNYSRDPVRGRLLPLDVARKPFGPGGVLITATEHQPSPDSENDLERLRSIRDTWNANGLLSRTWEKA